MVLEVTFNKLPTAARSKENEAVHIQNHICCTHLTYTKLRSIFICINSSCSICWTEKATTTEMGYGSPRWTLQCKHQGVSQLTS